jgi:hypothetical protein
LEGMYMTCGRHAAHAAMETGRRRLHYLVHRGEASSGMALPQQVSAYAVRHFQRTLDDACRTPLPAAWQQAAAVGWVASAVRWLPTLPLP